MRLLEEMLRKLLYYAYHSRAKTYVSRRIHLAEGSRSGLIRSLAHMLIIYQGRVIGHFKSGTYYGPTVKTCSISNGGAIPLDRSSVPNYGGMNCGPEAMEYPKISIVTPNYNQGRFLEECIQSVLSQNYPNLEYIVIDGGSTDDSLDVIKRNADRIHYWISERDGGQADAINKGLGHATGKIFNWLNSDDRLMPDALFMCADAYRQNQTAAGWVGACCRLDEQGNIVDTIFPNGLDRENIGQNWNGKQFYQPSCFLSTEMVKAIGGLDPSLYIALDLDLWIRLLEKGDFVVGKGTWSTAINHDNAKTQKYKGMMVQETADLQRKHGFFEGAERRMNIKEKKVFEYTIPDYLIKKLARDAVFPRASESYKSTYEKRNNLCFVGDFSTREDLDAVIYFLRDIFPVILRQDWLEFHIIGRRTDVCKKMLSRTYNVKFIELAGHFTELLAQYKLFVCPMTDYGGMRGKIRLAAAAGLPIVTTTNGLEGLPVRDGEDCFISDSPVEFGEKCSQCFNDRIVWNNLSIRSRLISLRYFGVPDDAEPLIKQNGFHEK